MLCAVWTSQSLNIQEALNKGFSVTILFFCYSLMPTSKKENFPIEIQATERRVEQRAGDEGQRSHTLCSSAGPGFSSGISVHGVSSLASEGTYCMNTVCRHTQAKHPYTQFHFNKRRRIWRGRMEGKNEELTCAVHSAWAKEHWVVNTLEMSYTLKTMRPRFMLREFVKELKMLTQIYTLVLLQSRITL